MDTGYYDAAFRRAEIEKLVEGIGSENRTKCKKVLRGDMTCYSCVDDKSVTNEECVYVNDPEIESSKKSSRITNTTTVAEVTIAPTEKTIATTTTSWKPIAFKRTSRQTKEESKEEDEEQEVLDVEREVEPYDFVSETRPVYDKVLGLTVPAYMSHKSEHEIEFDEHYSSRF